MSLSRTIRSLAASIAVCFTATTVSAALLATNDFETSYADFSADGEEALDSLVSLANYDNDEPSGDAALPFSGFGSKYLAMDSGTTTVWRTFTSQSADVYFDSYTKFTPTFGNAEYPSDSKIVIFLDANTNLCAISGTSAGDRTPVTNILSSSVLPDSWHRLTVSARKSGGVYAFGIKLDGTPLAPGGNGTFYSLTESTTMSEVGFNGTGAIENLAVRTTPPADTAAAVIDGEDFASLEDAITESDGRTITLAADHSAPVGIAAPGSYAVNTNSYAFGGLYGTGGATVASSTSGSVITYTVRAPVAVWDGATSLHNFSTLTRTCGGTTYTMTVNDANARVNDAKDYITIGNENQKWTVKVTSDKEGAFGTADGSGFTVIAKVANAGTSADSNRAVLNYFTSSSQAVAAFAQAKGGKAFPMVAENAQSASATAANTLLSDGTVQQLAMTYDTTDGIKLFVDGSRKWYNSVITSFAGVPEGITLGGVPVDSSTKLHALCGMKIHSVAVFNTKLTEEEVATYRFPSEIDPDSTMYISEDTPVSTINAVLGDASEIWLQAANGATVTGDTTFTASTVHFISAGEVVVYPPAGNTATFDFSGAAKPVVAYNDVLPARSGSTFTSTTIPTWVTDSAQWKGTIWLKNRTNVTAFESNPYGNAGSVLRLTGIKGWLKTPYTGSNYNTNGGYTNAVPIELSNDGAGYGLWVSNGNSANDNYPQRYTVFNKLQGSGTFKGSETTGNRAVFVVRDWSDFTGNIDLSTKVVVFGDYMPAKANTKDGQIYVMPGKTLNIPSSATWNATELTVEGTLQYESLARLSAKTSVTLLENGVVSVTGQDTFANDFSKVSGKGTVSLTPTSSWIGLPTNNLSTALGVRIESGSMVVPPINGNIAYTTNVVEIGSLSGSGTIQGNYGNYHAYRKLRIIQSTNTVWSGTVTADSENRLYEFAVAPGASSSGTLEISGDNSNKNTILTIESGANVDITGTWKGAISVAGTLGGTGTANGAVSLSNGAALKINDMDDTLGATSITASGAVSVYLPDGATPGKKIVSSSAASVGDASFSVYVNDVLDSSLDVVATAEGLWVVSKAGKGIRFEFR